MARKRYHYRCSNGHTMATPTEGERKCRACVHGVPCTGTLKTIK